MLVLIILLSLPVVFFVWYKYKNQDWQFAMAIVAYAITVTFLIFASLWHQDQTEVAENIFYDFEFCIENAEYDEDFVDCFVMLNSDMVLYEREYK